MGDHLVVARYLLMRVAEEYGLVISYDPKIFKEWIFCGTDQDATLTSQLRQ